jgi:hypothetical protein
MPYSKDEMKINEDSKEYIQSSMLPALDSCNNIGACKPETTCTV